METIKVRLGERSYPVIIGNNILSGLGSTLRRLEIGTQAVVITTQEIKRLFGGKLRKSLKKSSITLVFKEIPDTEKSKSLRCAEQLLDYLAGIKEEGSLFMIAFGGGVTGDLTGFVAAVYKRGIPYVQVPTTLLGQVDSAIGGKTAVDLPAGKNLAGAFYQPKLVFSDISFLNTLPQRELRCGMAEIIKYGIIADRSLFIYLEENLPEIIKLNKHCMISVIHRCTRIKARVVEIDEYDRTEKRMILNFGHTIGHAIEAAARYSRYRHGEAISIGMVCAAEISARMGMLALEEFERIEKLLLIAGLPTRIKKCALKDILKAQSRDKKFIGGKNRFVLPERIGHVVIRRDIPLKTITEVLKRRLV